MRALVVDDEPLVARAIVRVLGSMGYETSVALDGESALAVIDSWRKLGLGEPNLIVSDGHMPRMSGRQLHDVLPAHLQERMVFYTGDHSYLFEGLPNPVVQKPDTITLRSALVNMGDRR